MPRPVCIGLLGILAIARFATITFATPLTTKEVETERITLAAHVHSLRAAVNNSSTVYVRTLDGDAFFIYEASPIFPMRTREPISVLELTGGPNKVTAGVWSNRRGGGKISFYPVPGKQLDLSTLRMMLTEAFDDSSASGSAPTVYGNRKSRMAHARGCNHLPDADQLEPFASPIDAASAGYTLCPICFRRSPLVPDYPTEKTLGDACAAQFRHFNPVVNDDTLSERVRKAGKRVLSNWPAALRGYDYHFYVVENDQPNAVACPAGNVFVTTGLLKVLEFDDELDAVLAHEIAHVERRHGYRQLLRAQKGGVIGGLLGAIAGVVIASKGGSETDAEIAIGALQVVSQVATGIALAGYGRREEGEADSYALAYLGSQTANPRSQYFSGILSKLKYSDDMNGIHGAGSGLYMTHPEIDDRIAKARTATAICFPRGTSFGGYNSGGRLLVTVTLESEAFFDFMHLPKLGTSVPIDYAAGGREIPPASPVRVRELQVFASVQPASDLTAPIEVSSISVAASGKKYELDNKEDTQIAPGDLVGINFVTENAEGLLARKIESIRIKILGVDHWAALPSPVTSAAADSAGVH